MKGVKISLKGEPVVCRSCGNDRFVDRTIRKPQGMDNGYTLEHLFCEIVGQYQCTACGVMHEFLDVDIQEEIRCLSCGNWMKPDCEQCPSCGWSYRDTDGTES